MTRYDWEKIKEDFTYGYIDETGQKTFPTLKQLSTKYGCGYGTIRDHASKEGWSEDKDTQQTKINRKVEEHKTNREAQDIVLSDDKFENAGEMIRRVAVKKLEQIEGDLEDDKFVRSIDIVNVASAVKTGQDVVKTAQGEITNRMKIESSNVNLNILDEDFQEKELEFMKKLIK